MRIIVSVLLSMLLLVSLCANALAVVDTDSESWGALESGLEVKIPNTFRDAKGYITFTDSGEGIDPGSGMVSAMSIYAPMSGDEYRAIMDEEFNAYENGEIEKLTELAQKTSSVEWTLFEVYGINKGRGADELRSILMDRNVNPAYYNGDEALLAGAKRLFENMNMREIGEKDGLRYYLYWFAADDYLSNIGGTQADSVYYDELKDFWPEWNSWQMILN